MKTKLFLLFSVTIFIQVTTRAQNKKADSTAAVTTLRSLLAACKNVDFKDPKTSELGTFYKAAQYILYQGDDKKRAFKSFANYSKEEDKKGVDEVCVRINQSVNRDDNMKIEKYLTEKESEGIWHIVIVSYKKNDSVRKASFAFLKIGDRFGLGDVD